MPDQKPLPKKYNSSVFNGVIAAVLSGGVEGTLFTPLDRFKHILLAEPRNTGETGWNHTVRTAKTTMQYPKRLLSGGLAYTGYKVAQRITGFASQDAIRSCFAPHVSPFYAGLAGGMTSAVLELWMYPIDTIKIGQQIHHYSFRESAKVLYQRAGLVGFFSGLGATLPRNLIGSGLTFATFASVQEKKVFNNKAQDDALASGMATIARLLPTHFFDRIKVLKQSDLIPRELSLSRSFQHLYEQQGMQGLTQGFWARNLLSGSKFCFGLFFFYQFKDWIKKVDFESVVHDRKDAVYSWLSPVNHHKQKSHKVLRIADDSNSQESVHSVAFQAHFSSPIHQGNKLVEKSVSSVLDNVVETHKGV